MWGQDNVSGTQDGCLCTCDGGDAQNSGGRRPEVAELDIVRASHAERAEIPVKSMAVAAGGSAAMGTAMVASAGVASGVGFLRG